jgi:hypothetical protein
VPYILTFTSNLTPMINILPEVIGKEIRSSFRIINFKTLIFIHQKLQRMEFFFTTHTLRSSLFSFCIYTFTTSPYSEHYEVMNLQRIVLSYLYFSENIDTLIIEKNDVTCAQIM